MRRFSLLVLAVFVAGCAAPLPTPGETRQTAEAAEAALAQVADFCPTGPTCTSTVEFSAEGQIHVSNGQVGQYQAYRVTVNGGVPNHHQRHDYSECWYDQWGDRWCY
jgi:hypothetical protein